MGEVNHESGMLFLHEFLTLDYTLVSFHKLKLCKSRELEITKARK